MLLRVPPPPRLFAAAVVAVLFVSGCGGDSGPAGPGDPQEYSLDASRVGAGTLVSSPTGIALSGTSPSGATDFIEGTEVTLVATPATGWEITGWGGACSGAGAGSTCVVTMTESRTVSVTFEELPPPEYTLIASLTGEGTLVSSPSGIALSGSNPSGAADFVEGTEVTLLATPPLGWEITGWGGACSGAGAGSTCVVTMTEGRTVSVSFAEPGGASVTILTDSLPQGFEGFAVALDLEAETDPPGAAVTWSLGSGTLPAGLALSPGGALSGTPTESGTFAPQFVATTTGGGQASVTLDLEICPGVADLAPGETAVLAAPSPCGLLLPDATGQRYTVGIMPRAEVTSGLDLVSVPGGVRLTLRAGAPGAFAEPPPSPALVATAEDPAPALAARQALDEAMARVPSSDEVRFPNTEAYHVALREEEVRVFNARLGPVELGPAEARDGPLPTPEAEKDFFVRFEGTAHSITAQLRGVSDHVLFYQDEVSVAAGELTQAEIDGFLAFYDAYGHSVIENAFGGLGPDGTISTVFQDDGGTPLSVSARDIDGNGRLIVLWVREALFPQGVAGYVASCDRFPRPGNRQPGSPLGVCTGSNQAEITYMRSLSPHTLVHEVKHISSHGWAAYGPRWFNQSWIEEGTAEIAKEMAARAARGYGPDDRAGAEFWDGSEGAQGMWQLVSRANSWLLAQPDNPLFGRSATNRWGFYGAAWLYHRYLADTYGRANFASDAAFFRYMNEGYTSRGAIAAGTGVSVEATLPGFLAAVATGGALGTPGDLVGWNFHSFGPLTSHAANWPKPLFEEGFVSADIDLAPRYSSTLHGKLENGQGTHLLLNLRRPDGGALAPADLFVLTVTRMP